MTQRAAGKSSLRVVVVGAGIVGASIAYHLIRRGVSVTLVDKGTPGAGATSHSFAWINAGAKAPSAYHEFSRRSLEMWDRFVHHLGTDVGLQWGGKISWESTEEKAQTLREQVSQLQRWGYPTRMVDASELASLEPALSLGTVVAAEYSEIEGHVEQERVVHACVERVVESGGGMQYNTLVTALPVTLSDQKVRVVETDQGEIPCDVVVLAAGTEMTKLAALPGIHLPQEESPGVVIRTSPLAQLLQSVSVVYAPALDAEHSEIHIRQTSDGVVMIGEGSQESLREDDSQAHANDLLARATQYLPGLAPAKAIPVPVGYRPMPLDGYPVLGFADAVPNLYIALTHSGITLAPLIGELAAIEIVDDVRAEVLSAYRVERFSRFTHS